MKASLFSWYSPEGLWNIYLFSLHMHFNKIFYGFNLNICIYLFNNIKSIIFHENTCHFKTFQDMNFLLCNILTCFWKFSYSFKKLSAITRVSLKVEAKKSNICSICRFKVSLQLGDKADQTFYENMLYSTLLASH